MTIPSSDPSLQPNLNPQAPPTIKTLVYSPDARLYIVHNNKQYDVSADLVWGQVNRKENSASHLTFRLANKPLNPGGQPRYNAGEKFAFSRMDPVTLYLKRTKYIQVFTGFLDTIPYKQIYPGVAEFRATCTLKKLMHTWWNPAIPGNFELLDQLSFGMTVAGDGQLPIDSGMGSMLRNLIVKVGKYDESQVHIQNFPIKMFPFVQEYISRTNPSNQAAVEAYKTLLLGSDHTAAPKGSAGYNPSAPLGVWPPAGAGAAGPETYLPFLVAACDARGMGPLTTNLQQASAIQAAGQSGASASTQKDAAAWQLLANQGQNQTAEESESDAAALAFACILVESQGRNVYNAGVPESTTFPNDGPLANPNNADGVGLFVQGTGYGAVMQRMNPYAAAGMFYDKLNAFGWRNMGPGAAIYKVQNGAASSLYDAAYEATAKNAVKAYREAQGKGTATTMAMVAATAVPLPSSVAGSVVNSVTNAVGQNGVGSPSSTGAGPVAGSARIGKPNPDSEGAINAAHLLIATPFKYGGSTPGVEMDATGLVSWAFRAIGKDAGDTIGAQLNNPRIVPTSLAQRGDIIQLSTHEHTGIYLGDGTWLTMSGPPGSPGGIEVLPEPLEMVKAVVRVCPNGGLDPTAPFTPPIIGLPRGTPAGTGDSQAQGASSQVLEPIARNLFAYQFEPWEYSANMADLFHGEKAYIDSQPLIQIVQAIAKASMRNFASAPNGDFIAYTPDEFGMYGKPAILALEDIEITNCMINLSDDPLTTHVYVEGNQTIIGQTDQELGWLMTSGVATMENTALFEQLRKNAPGDMVGMTGMDIMRKFGVRPLKQNYQLSGSAALEFLLACQLFMGKWSAMYETNMSFTFMPDLFPGMRVSLVGHNLQLYCSEVTHTFDYEQGFTTTARLSSVSSPNAAKAIEGSNPLSNWSWPSDFGRGPFDTVMSTTGTINGTGATSTQTSPGG